MKPIYFDYNATTPIAPEVLDAMMPFLTENWGNPSSAYRFGKGLSKPLQEARNRVAALIHAEPSEIVFTSCGTESNNTALLSALASHPAKSRLVTTSVEHSAILKHARFLEKKGTAVALLPVDADGSIDLHRLEKTITPETALVSVMTANNETGVLFPIEEIAALCRSKKVLFHTDAVQAAGKIKLDVKASGVDFLSLSAHKLHAPKGIGALYIRRGAPFESFVHGGSQEQGKRGGTENVPFIIGFGRAAALAAERLQEERRRVGAMRDRFEKSILRSVQGVSRNGGVEARLCNTSNLAFQGIEAEALLLQLDRHGICASSGSACMTGSLVPSHVLTAMGLNPSLARGSLRFSFGWENTEEDIDRLIELLPGMVENLRLASPLGNRDA